MKNNSNGFGTSAVIIMLILVAIGTLAIGWMAFSSPYIPEKNVSREVVQLIEKYEAENGTLLLVVFSTDGKSYYYYNGRKDTLRSFIREAKLNTEK